MQTSVLDAIKQGTWDFEPAPLDRSQFVPTEAVPGSAQKVSVLAERLRLGQPLWHPDDRRGVLAPAAVLAAELEEYDV